MAAVQASLSVQVTLDLPELDEPASGLVLSLPDDDPPMLNRLFLRAGRWLRPGGQGEILVGEAFAAANQLRPGDALTLLLNGGNVTTSAAVIVTVSNLSGGSLINNPSLEIDANNNGVPDCWILGGYGSNTYVWSRVTSAHSGNFAESLQVTSLSSGDRKLVQTQDSGACAPAVTPGSRYTLSAWYTSTVPTAFVVYYRTSAGRWVYWTESSGVPAASNWTQTLYTTPVIPAGATHLSFGLYLSSVGTLVTDDYAMTPAP